ncbi:hypothetical protein DV736_g6354, partial [Chaetothyriales sp. CBS 134916]
MASKREFDIVLLGATGYTGKLTAEYLIRTLSTSFKWAIAGRSESKLKEVASELKSINNQGAQPSIVTTGFTASDLDSLTKKSTVIINLVGPYHLYSSPVVEAAAKNGTHYIDATGETPWVKEMIVAHEATAKKTGAILVLEDGLESAPSDLLAFKAAQLVRKVWDCGVSDMVASIHELSTSGPSGGTLATALSLFDHYPLGELRQMFTNAFVLTPQRLQPYTPTTIYPANPQPNTYIRSLPTRLFGVWSYPRLGNLTTSLSAKSNEAIVQRSAGLNPYLYGFNFTYEEYMAVSNPFWGVVVHLATVVIALALIFPPTRALLKLLPRPASGAGPDLKARKAQGKAQEVLEMRGVAIAEQLSRIPRKAMAKLRYEGSLYELTAVCLAAAAVVLLDAKALEELRDRFGGGGFLTPASLGDRFVAEIEKGGVSLTAEQIGDAGSK